MQPLKDGLRTWLTTTTAGRFMLNGWFNLKYKNVGEYWESRYRGLRNSGVGSFGDLAAYKAAFLNHFVLENKIKKVTELGCGDGAQLRAFRFPQYVGVDISATAVENCKSLYANDSTKIFLHHATYFRSGVHIPKADLSLSLDVIYHLVEDDVFETYMKDLFSASSKYVIIYAWDVDGQQQFHVRHRKFSSWIQDNLTDWSLVDQIEPTIPGACDFFIYQKIPVNSISSQS